MHDHIHVDPPFISTALLSCALQDVESARSTLSALTSFMLPFCCVISEGLAFGGAHYAACINLVAIVRSSVFFCDSVYLFILFFFAASVLIALRGDGLMTCVTH